MFDDQVRLGTAGTWCQMKVAKSDPVSSIVSLTAPNDSIVAAHFAMSGDKWVMVGIEGVREIPADPATAGGSGS